MKLTKKEEKEIWKMAERCAGVPKGQKWGRWTHEDRAVIVYAVICSLMRLNKNGNKNTSKKN
jgi:hypothetical protein